MQASIRGKMLVLKRGDICKEEADVLVNCSNSALAGGGAVDQAIRKAAGEALMADCRKSSGCVTGRAVPTTAGRLPAKWVVHTVGPVWSGGQDREEELLESCYQSSLKIAEGLGARTIAFPAVATGIFGFPIEPAARIALQTIGTYLQGSGAIERVTLILFSDEVLEIHEEVLEELAPRFEWQIS